MADNKCYTVVEFDKWKSHSEITNKNNHNFRVNPVDVLKPSMAAENEVLCEADGAGVKERWLKLADILDAEMKKQKYSKENLSVNEYRKLSVNNRDLRESFIEQAASAGIALDEKYAKEMIALAAEGIDLKRYYDNQNLIGDRSNFINQFEDKLAERGISKVRKNAVMEIGVVMKVTKGFENLPDGFDLEKWKADSMKWLKENFGEENILSAVYHADEFSPHIQASVIPITDDGRLSAKDFLPDWRAYSRAQDTYYDAVKQDGLYRGIKGGQPGFEDQRRAHNALVNAGDIDLPTPKWGEKTEDYHKRANESFKESGMQSHLKMKEMEREHLIEMSGLQDEIERLNARIEEADKREKIAKERARTLITENNFYREQLQGSGATTRELKDAATVASRLKEEYESSIKEYKVKESKMMDKITSLQKENGRLKNDVGGLKHQIELYDKIIVDGKLSPAALKNNALINYISSAFENGYPRTEEAKKEMQAAYKYGKDVQARNQILDKETDI